MLNVFISYTRNKDQYNAVTALRRHLVSELHNYDRDASCFQDTDSIRHGESIPQAIREALEQTDVLLVLVSPAWLKSTWCRSELTTYLELHPQGLVVPLLWVPTPGVDINDITDDPVATELSQRRCFDWGTYRHQPEPDLGPPIAELAGSLVQSVG